MRFLRALWARLRPPKPKIRVIPAPPDPRDEPNPLLLPAYRPLLPQRPNQTRIVVEPEPSDWDLLSDDEKALFEQITPHAPEKVVAYPPPAEQSVQDWVTEQLAKRTGGMTRHPYDRTDYPTPPNEVDLAARKWAAENMSGPRALYAHGYGMRYLRELQERAKRKDETLKTEDLMALRSRGLI